MYKIYKNIKNGSLLKVKKVFFAREKHVKSIHSNSPWNKKNEMYGFSEGYISF